MPQHDHPLPSGCAFSLRIDERRKGLDGAPRPAARPPGRPSRGRGNRRGLRGQPRARPRRPPEAAGAAAAARPRAARRRLPRGAQVPGAPGTRRSHARRSAGDAAQDGLERPRPFGKFPSRARDSRPVEMRAAEPPHPETRRGGGLSVEVRAQRTWPAGGGIVEDGRIRWRYSQRYRWKYRQRNTLAQGLCRGRRPRPSAAAPQGRQGRGRRSRAARSARRGPRASGPRRVKTSVKELSSPHEPAFPLFPRQPRACGRPGTMRSLRRRPSPQGQRRRRGGLPAGSAGGGERRRLGARREPHSWLSGA